MTQPRKEQINILRACWTVTTYTAIGNVTSTILPSSFVSSSVTQIPGGSIITVPPIRGIITTGATGGFVRLRQASNALTLDFNGSQIFGRLTYSSGNYILNYNILTGGIEAPATLPSGTYEVEMIFGEVMNFGEIPVNVDIIYGYSQELLPSGNTIPGNLVVDGNTVLGSSSSNTVSVNANFNTNLVPTPDNTLSLGTYALRFANTNTTQLDVRMDNTNSIKSVLTADSLITTGTAFVVDGNNNISIGSNLATAINLGNTDIITTINGTLVAAGMAIVDNNLIVNGSSSVFNGNLNVTGLLTTGSISFANLNVSGNTILGSNSGNTINLLGSIISTMLPQAPDTYDIGSPLENWRNVHSTRLFSHYDTNNISYSFLEPNNLFSSVDFDIDGYGALFLGTTYSNNIALGNFTAAMSLDGYNITTNANNNISIQIDNSPILTIGASGANVHTVTSSSLPANGWTVYTDGYDNILKAKNASGHVANLSNLGGSIQLALGGVGADGPVSVSIIQPSLDFPNATRCFLYAMLWTDLNTPPVWATNTTNNINDIVSNVQSDGTRVAYVCTVGGTSGVSGSGPLGIGTNLSDGTGSSVRWRAATAQLTLEVINSSTIIFSGSINYTLAAGVEAGLYNIEIYSEITSAIMELTQPSIIAVGVSGDPADTNHYTRGEYGPIKLIFI